MDHVLDTMEIQQARKESMNRRHNSMLITNVNVKESSKWLQQYSNFNLLEQQELLIKQVTSIASQFDFRSRADSDLGSMNVPELQKSISQKTMGTKINQFEAELVALETLDFDCFKMS